MSLANLQVFFDEHRTRVNDGLKRFLGAPSGPAFERMYAAVSYSLEAGGKRVRPLLALATAQALDFPTDRCLPFACALEMIHTYSLIHDDLPAMDNDDLRRGQPTNHKIHGEAAAILAGDALLTKAFEVLAASDGMTLDVIREVAVAAGIDGMVGGQLMDLDAEDRKIALPELERIHRHKTGALLRVSITGAARLAGGTPGQVEKLDAYGRAIGLAFQIADDILDIEGGAEIGKDVGSDLNKDKATYPKFLGLAASKQKAAALVEEALAALTIFDSRADLLREFARYIVQRKN